MEIRSSVWKKKPIARKKERKKQQETSKLGDAA